MDGNFYTPPAGMPPTDKEEAKKVEHKRLPVCSPNEDRESYFLGINPETPLQNLHLLGLTFERYIYPVERSLMENVDKHYAPGLPIMSLTERQAEAIRERAEEIEIRISRRYCWKSKGWLAPEVHKASDVIIFKKVSEYNPAFPTVVEVVEHQVEKDLGDEMRESIYKQQAKPRKVKK